MHLLTQLVPLLIALAAILATSLTLTPPTPQIIGKTTTIVWGTAPGGTAIVPIVTSMVVTSIDISPTNPTAVANLENENGAIFDSVYLDDGFEATVEGIFDTALTYPVQASAVSLTLPKAVDLSNNAVHTVFPCTIESNPIKLERKKEAMISFKISHHPGRDGAPTA